MASPGAQARRAGTIASVVVVVVMVTAVLAVGRGGRDETPVGAHATSAPSTTAAAAPPTTTTTTVDPTAPPPPPTTLPPGSLQPTAWPGPQRLAFVNDATLRVLDETGTVHTVHDSSPMTRPRWSPDSEWLAYEAGGELWVSRWNGSQAHEVASPVYRWAWSPREPTLAVLRGAPNRPTPIDLYRPESPGSPAAVVNPDSQVLDFAWSPDGQSIAFTGFPAGPFPREPGISRLAVAAADGSAPPQPFDYMPRPEDGKDACLYLAGWAPDQSGLLVWFDPLCSASIAADGLDLESIPLGGGAGTSLNFGLMKRAWVVSSPTGGVVLVDGGGRDLNAHRSIRRCTTAHDCRAIVDNLGGSTFDPAWSPDGRRLAFVRTEIAPNTLNLFPQRIFDYDRRRLWIGNADGSDAGEVEAAGMAIGAPQWLRDGRHIVYTRADYLWLLDVDADTAVPLVGPIRGHDSTIIENAYEGSDAYGGGWQALFALSP